MRAWSPASCSRARRFSADAQRDAGRGDGKSPTSGALVWLETIIAFTFAYWESDAGGPRRALIAPENNPHLAFPEHMNPALAPPGWRARFVDYLYLGLYERRCV